MDRLAIQACLNALGFNPGPIDGDFGPRTAADPVFEKARGLPFDSAVDPGFTAALFAGVAAKEPAWLTETRKDLDVNGGVGAADIPDVVKMFAEAGRPESSAMPSPGARGPSMPGCTVPASRVQTGCATCSQKISSTSKSRCP